MHVCVYSCRVCDLEMLIKGSVGHINVPLLMVLNLHHFFLSTDIRRINIM